MKMRLPCFSFLLIVFVLASCSSTNNLQLQQYINKVSCHQQNEVRYNIQAVPQPLYQLTLDTILTSHFTPASLQVAHAFGLLDILGRYVHQHQQYTASPTLDERISLLELSQQIHNRINQASLEISSFASELDCEEERLTQIADYLKGKERERESKLTVAAIVVGATGGIGSSALALGERTDKAGNYVAIASGVTEAVLGILMLTNNRTLTIEHPRNALKDVWEGKDTSDIFPASIWYYINYYDPAHPDQPSLRYQILQRWMSFKQIDVASTRNKKKLLDMYFGDGGRYSTDQLYNRANMYDQLESYIKLIKQDVMALSLQVENIH